jgi:hypothetical protein
VTPAPATAQAQQDPPTQSVTPAPPERTPLEARERPQPTVTPPGPPAFHERQQPDPRDRAQPALRPERQALLRARIKDLRLQLAGTHLDRLIHQLHEELGARSLDLRPQCYLSDEWAAAGIPVTASLLPGQPGAPVDRGRAGRRRGVGAGDPHVPPPRGGALLQLRLPLYPGPRLASCSALSPAVQGGLRRSPSPGPTSRTSGWYAQKHPDDSPRPSRSGSPRPDWRQRYRNWEPPEEAPVRGRHCRAGHRPPQVRWTADIDADQMRRRS